MIPIKLECLGYRMVKKNYHNILSLFDKIPDRDGQTDRQKCYQHCASVFKPMPLHCFGLSPSYAFFILLPFLQTLNNVYYIWSTAYTELMCKTKVIHYPRRAPIRCYTLRRLQHDDFSDQRYTLKLKKNNNQSALEP